MAPTDLAVAFSTLLGAIMLGTITHELTHALALYAFGVPCEITWFPRDRTRTTLGSSLAVVTPRISPEGLTPWHIQLSALMPLALALPFLLVPIGILPNPVAGGNLPAVAATIGWLACAIPSPQDFSLVWHPTQAIEHACQSQSEP